MSDVREREEAIRMLLAEVAPGLKWRITEDGSFGFPENSPNRAADPRRKAHYLWVMSQRPMAMVPCPVHFLADDCPKVPVSWALLGHTCGRSDGAA